MRKEALLTNVTDFKMEFFFAPESEKEEKENKDDAEEPAKKPPMGSWTDTWQPKTAVTAAAEHCGTEQLPAGHGKAQFDTRLNGKHSAGKVKAADAT